MLSRRDFLLATSSALAILAIRPAQAGLHHGSSGAVQKVGLAVVNAGSSIQGFINLAKGFVPTSTQANFLSSSVVNADGFPISNAAMSADWQSAQAIIDPAYYGRYYCWWTGTGNIELSPGVIVYSGGNSVFSISPASSGALPFNVVFGAGGASQPTVGAPIEFAFGVLISAVGNNAGLVQFTSPTANAFANIPTGAQFQFNNLTGLPAGPNADGSWTVTVNDATHITLQGSAAYVGLVSVTGAGGPGIQTEALLSITVAIGCTITVLRSNTISGWSNIVWCKKAHYAAAVAGQLASPDYVTAIKALNPRFLRFMDYQAVQSDRSSSYTYRSTPSNFSWGAVHQVTDYYAGTVTKGGADAYTCANPVASPASGAYVDGEVVIGQISGANAGYSPTLALTGRTGSAPILNTNGSNSASLINLFLTGTVPTVGTVQTFVFTGGGLGSPHTVNYTTNAGDNSLQNLGFNLINAFRADTTLTGAGISVPFNGTAPTAALSFEYNPNIGGLGVSRLTVTGSDASSHTTYNWGTQDIGGIPDATYTYFTYSALMGAWFCRPQSTTQGGINMGPPLEFYADLCNRAGVGCYVQVGLMWSADRISKTVDFFARTLNGEFKIGFSNETWNRFLAEWSPSSTLGNCLGLSDASGGNQSVDSFTGLRVAQVSQLAQAAWAAAGRSRSQLHVQLEFDFVDISASSGFSVPNRFNGAKLNPAINTTLASFGGLGATSTATNFSAFPNRPIDWADECGGAPYYNGGQLNCVFDQNLRTTDYSSVAITISAYNSLLLAAYNYAYGTAPQKATALDFFYNENSGPAGDLYSGTLNGTPNDNQHGLSTYAVGSGDPLSAGTYGIGTVIAGYDSARAGAGMSQLGYCCYEGDLQQNTPSASSLTGLGYTNGYSSSLPGAAAGGPTGASDTAALAAANILNAYTAFQNDNRFKLLTTKYLNICQTSGWWNGSASINRMSLGTHYGFDGPNVWAFYPNSILTTPFKSWDAYQAFDN